MRANGPQSNQRVDAARVDLDIAIRERHAAAIEYGKADEALFGARMRSERAEAALQRALAEYRRALLDEPIFDPTQW